MQEVSLQEDAGTGMFVIVGRAMITIASSLYTEPAEK
jgi:hypothetical protein